MFTELTPRRPRASDPLDGTLDAAGAVATAITDTVQAVHRAVAATPFQLLAALPGLPEIRRTHDEIADGVYAVVRESTRQATRGARWLARQRPPPTQAHSTQRDLAIGALNGAFGNHLVARGNGLAQGMAWAHHGAPLATDPATLRAALPQASGRVAVFIHGLCCTESVWQFYRDDNDGLDYPQRLRGEGWTPLLLRYNSGLRIADNGQTLSDRLTELLAAYPAPIQELALIGHSMGGLVARSAVHSATREQAPWLACLRQVICLGSPHRGAPLEKIGWAATALLGMTSYTRPFAGLARARSAGIKDLRHGYVAPADGADADLDHQWGPPAQACERPAHVRIGFIGSVLGPRLDSALAYVVGDGLVRLDSATARQLADADVAAVSGRHHLRLLNDPQVYAQIRAWLQPQADNA